MRIVDADGHVQDKNIPWRDLIAEPFKSRAPQVVKDNRGVEFIMMEGRLCPKPGGKGCSFVGARDLKGSAMRSRQGMFLSWT